MCILNWQEQSRPLELRPITARAKDLVEECRRIAESLRETPGLVGIVLSGGVSRGVADEYSDLDIALYLEPWAYRSWLEGRGPVPARDTLLQNHFLAVEYCDIEAEAREAWSLQKRWDRSYAIILLDTNGRIARLLQEKVQLPETERRRYLLRNLYDAEWYCALAKIWVHRDDVLSAHFMLNISVSKLLAVAFLLNREYVPIEKWSLHLARRLLWLPADFEACLTEALRVERISEEEVARRRRAIKKLLRACIERVLASCPRYAKPLDWKHNGWLQPLILLIIKGAVPFKVFTYAFDRSCLSTEPLFRLTYVEDRGGEPWVVLRREKLQELAEGSDEVIEPIRRELSNLLRKLSVSEIYEELADHFCRLTEEVRGAAAHSP